ncbi:MAG: TRAP transporter TatT component family protein [Pyrinomonadaceae bacterium]|nr:TRAP transporter TatT component family protein [Pyrinomonadaceae bacterium]
MRKLQSIGLILLLQIAPFAGLSCRNQQADADKNLGQPNKIVGTEKIAEADKLYSHREDLQKARLGVVLLRQARTADYSSYEAEWKLARICYYLGSHTDDERERDRAFREGIEAGKTAVRLSSEKPEGHFWLGANYGGAAEHSTLAGLSSIQDIRSEMEAVLKIDEGFRDGSAYMILGQLYLEAPRLLRGDHQKALEYLEKGLTFGSGNALLRVRLAEAYHAVKRDAEARKQIDVVLKMTPNPDYLPEYKEAVDEAKKLIEKMDRTSTS